MKFATLFKLQLFTYLKLQDIIHKVRVKYCRSFLLEVFKKTLHYGVVLWFGIFLHAMKHPRTCEDERIIHYVQEVLIPLNINDITARLHRWAFNNDQEFVSIYNINKQEKGWSKFQFNIRGNLSTRL
ncbi:hypothetical protein BdWA1_002406 [Babesia duncani]|uniref:Uncharacterized protein n=1 Tax=Babesia duncani TaxID=323732 RepID=A0AAD9PJ64_9APIC|nr:hypothetical protein BdWA1_002406 [Babesia duncani]